MKFNYLENAMEFTFPLTSFSLVRSALHRPHAIVERIIPRDTTRFSEIIHLIGAHLVDCKRIVVVVSDTAPYFGS